MRACVGAMHGRNHCGRNLSAWECRGLGAHAFIRHASLHAAIGDVLWRIRPHGQLLLCDRAAARPATPHDEPDAKALRKVLREAGLPAGAYINPDPSGMHMQHMALHPRDIGTLLCCVHSATYLPK